MPQPRTETPTVQTDIRDFGGIVLQADPHDLAPGEAQDQVNIGSDQQGSLLVRMGSLQVSFDSTTP